MGQQVKSWCRQHERLLIFISFLLLWTFSILSIFKRILRASDFRFHQNRVEGLALAIKTTTGFLKSIIFLGRLWLCL